MKWTAIWDRFRSDQIIVYADFIDPFCYVGFHNARRAADTAKIPLVWRGFELNPGTPEGGALLQPAANSDLRPGMWSSVREFAKKSGLLLTEPTHVPNTRLALLWVQTLKNRDVKNSLIERIYQAYLSDKKDLGDPQVLLGLAGEFGLPEKSIHHLGGQQGSSLLNRFRQEALDHGFAGMPGFFYKGKTYFGALSEEAWQTILKKETS